MALHRGKSQKQKLKPNKIAIFDASWVAFPLYAWGAVRLPDYRKVNRDFPPIQLWSWEAGSY